MLSAHHRAASENVITSGYYPSSPPPISPLSSFAAAQVSLEEQQPSSHLQSHSVSGKVRRPSITSAINWLSNAPAIQHMKGPQSVVISAPSIDGVERFGELGKGATIVRTPAEALRQMGSNNSSSEFHPSPLITPRPFLSHAASPSLPVNPMPLPNGRDYFEEHSPYAPTRLANLNTGSASLSHPHHSASGKHRRTGSRTAVATILESELPPLPQSPMLAPRDALPSRGSSEARRSGGSGENSGSARSTSNNSSNSGRRHAPAQSMSHLHAPPLPLSNSQTSPNGSPSQLPLKLRDQDSSSGRGVPFQGFSTSLPLTPGEDSHSMMRRSPAPPPLPMDLLLSPSPQPAFDAMLMAPLPSDLHKTDTSKVIVILETSTASQKTTLQTLISRPSHLAAHLVGLYHSTATKVPTSASAVTLLSPKSKKSRQSSPTGDAEDAASVYSERSEFSDSGGENGVGLDAAAREQINVRRQRKLTKSITPPVIHIFMDRPSAPYVHLLSYLRSPASPSSLNVPGALDTPQPGSLPAAVRVFYPHNCSRSRLELLLDLRNEASYVGLTDLVELCTAELAFVGTASSAPPTPDLECTSLHSTHTLCEPSEDGSAGSKKGFNTLFSKLSSTSGSEPAVVPLDVIDAMEKEREREKAREREQRAAREREMERVQAALHTRRQNAGARDYDDRGDRYRFPASSSLSGAPIVPVSRSDSLYYARSAKSVSPARGRRADAPIAVKPPSGDYF